MLLHGKIKIRLGNRILALLRTFPGVLYISSTRQRVISLGKDLGRFVFVERHEHCVMH